MFFPDHPLFQRAFSWASAPVPPNLPPEEYCPVRDVLYGRLDSLLVSLIRKNIPEEKSLLLHAILSEIGGNSFDHNIGQWKDAPGVLFARTLDPTPFFILADRGQGIRRTLLPVKPSLANDEEALRTAFLEQLSSRAPERRGNGLKFVRRELLQDGIDLFFQSGTACYAVTSKEESWKSVPTSIPGCLAVLSFSR